MSDAKKSRTRLVLGVGIGIVAIGLGLVAYIPSTDPLMLGVSTVTVMFGYALGRWAVHRMADGDE